MDASSYRTEFRALIKLAGPLALVYVGNMLLGAVDTAVVGRLGEVPLGAVGLGNGLFFTVTVLGTGLMLGIDPLISQAVGAKEPSTALHVYRQGLRIAAALTLPLACLSWISVLAIDLFGIDPAVSAETRGYIFARLFGLLPILLLIGMRSYLQAYDRTLPLIAGMVTANVVNLPLSWVLVFGDRGLEDLGLSAIGLPSMGAAGAGWTSAFCSLLQMLIAWQAVRRLARQHGAGPRTTDPQVIRRAIGLGAPIALTLFAEVGSFSLVGILMALHDPIVLAAHNVALTLASATFQVPMAVGAAAAVRVGQAVGRKDTPGARVAGAISLATGGAFMLLASAAFLGFPRGLSRLVTDQNPVIEQAVAFLMVAAAFQFVDGIQAVGAGALRGAGDTRFAFLSNVIGHYAIGLPLGAILCFATPMGPVGLWWGLNLGLGCVALALSVRFFRISRRTIARA
ncbi:MAG: MATE family efflux transporter [Myxococcota bacterium]